MHWWAVGRSARSEIALVDVLVMPGEVGSAWRVTASGDEEDGPEGVAEVVGDTRIGGGAGDERWGSVDPEPTVHGYKAAVEGRVVGGTRSRSTGRASLDCRS